MNILGPGRNLGLHKPSHPPLFIDINPGVPISGVGAHDDRSQGHGGMSVGKYKMTRTEFEMDRKARYLVLMRNLATDRLNHPWVLHKGELKKVSDRGVVHSH